MTDIATQPPSEYIANTMSKIVHTYLHNAIEVLSTKFGFDKMEAYKSLNENLVFESNPEHDDFSEHIKSEPIYRDVATPTNDDALIQDAECSLENYLFGCLRDYHIPPPPDWRVYEFIPLKLIHITPVKASIKINKYTLKTNINAASIPKKFNQLTLAQYIKPDAELKEEKPYIVDQLLRAVKISDINTLEALKNLSEEMVRFQYDIGGKRYFMSKNIVYKFEITPCGTWNDRTCAIDHDPCKEFNNMFHLCNNAIQCLYAIDGDNYDRYDIEVIIEKDTVYLKADDGTIYKFKAYKIGGVLPSVGYISGYDVNSIFRLMIYNL